MSFLTAQEADWPKLETKMPAGQVWTSPNKPDGYLRRSVLQSLARRVGDDVDGPVLETLLAGTFEDTTPATGNPDTDKLATVALTILLQRQRRGADKEVFQDSESDDESGTPG
jgi:hypothetical protein